MSELLYNSETGKYETKDPLTGERTVVPTLDELEAQQGQWQDTTMAERSAMRVLPYKIEERLAAERKQQEYARALAAGEGAGDNRPMFAQNPGQFLGDLTKISLNMPLGLATDLVDIATTGVKAGPGQVVGIVSDLAQGQNPFTPERYQQRMLGAIDESQNWLTRTRREVLRPETQAGQFASNILRLATPSKLLTAPLKAAGVLKNIDKVADVAKFASPEALKAVGLVDNVTPGARGAIKAIQNAPNRRIPFKVVAEAAKRDTGALAVKNRWQGLETQVATMKASLGIGAPKKQWIKSAAEFIGWDLFMAYNVAGEGDAELDETLGDLFEDWTGIGNPLATDWTDNALTLKLKQMADAAIGGTIVGGAMDLFRVQRYARNFTRATAVEQRKILKLFDLQAEDIGVRITNAYDRPLLPTSNITTRGGPLARTGGEVVDYPEWRQTLDDYSNRLNGARQAQRQQLSPGTPRLDGVDEVQVREVREMLPGAGPDQPLLEGRFQIRGSEPVVEPTDWRAMAREAFSRSSGTELQRVMTQLNDLLPQERLNLVEFIERLTPAPNDLNLLPAPEQFAVNRLLRQGVSEGWVEFDANFDPVIRRARALEMDLADIDAEAGRDFDEVMRLRRTKEENQNNLIRQALDEMDERATDELAVEEGVDADGLSMSGEYERFLQEQPDGSIDEFREWLQQQDQLEWFLTQSQRSGRVPPASQLEPMQVPSADVRVGDVPEARPQTARAGEAPEEAPVVDVEARAVEAPDEAVDPLDRQIAEAEQRAQLSRQRSDAALARAAQAEADEVLPRDMQEAVQRLDLDQRKVLLDDAGKELEKRLLSERQIRNREAKVQDLLERQRMANEAGDPSLAPKEKEWKPLRELEEDREARKALADLESNRRMDEVVDGLDDFMRQIEDNGEICFP